MFVIVGARGYLGSYLVDVIASKSKEKILATYHSPESHLPSIENVSWQNLDVGSSESISNFADCLKRYKSSGELVKCIYVVGYIKPDDCLNNPDKAVNINVIALTKFLTVTKDLIDALVFSSTDFVFNESKNGYRNNEKDNPDPINFYGTVKQACESIVNMSGFTNVRLPFMFGRSLNPNRPHFIEHIDRVVKNNEQFDILSDYYENSLDYRTVAELIYALFAKFDTKIPVPVVHICGDEPVSKYQIALDYANKYGYSPVALNPIKLSDATFFKSKRATILMDNALVKRLLGLNSIKYSI